MSSELWKEISGYEGSYEVSNTGRVRSVHRELLKKNGQRHTVRERILKQRNHPNGYLMVSLVLDNKYGHFLVHRLVAMAFIGPCPIGMEVAHCDGSRQNNALSNLRYATPMDNTHDKYIHKTMLSGEENPVSKLTRAQVDQIRSDSRSQRVIAEEFGVTQTLISQIKLRKIWK